MDVAELYLSLVRPTGVPVVGECVAEGFIGQVEVERWNWNLMNDDEIKRAEKDEEDYSKHEEFLKSQPSKDLRKKLLALNNAKAAKSREDERIKAAETLTKALADAGNDSGKSQKARTDFNKTMEQIGSDEFRDQEKSRLAMENLSRDLTRKERSYLKNLEEDVGKLTDDKKLEKQITANDQAHEKENKSYKFSFSKRVDFATTQMLNSMKAGDVFPLAVLTIHQRSSNSGMSLVFTVTQLRLLDYSLRAEVTETMTDMKEQWTAEFRSLAYVYKNRKTIDGADGGADAATKSLTQGTVRTFAMKKDLGI